MSTILLTIAGPDHRVDLAMPGETPLTQLLPTFIEMAAPEARGEDPEAWVVSVEGGAQLAIEQSLAANEVADGAVLTLRRAGDEPEPEEAVEVDQPAPEAEEPVDTAPPEDEAAERPLAPPVPIEPAAPVETAPPPITETVVAVEEPLSVHTEPAPPVDTTPPPAEEPRRPAIQQTVRDSPRRRTLDALPDKPGFMDRLSAAASALGGNAPPAESNGDSPVNLTRQQTASQRVRAAWRDTDYQHRLDEAIRAPRLRQCATIAVVSPKGGVGKTTITTLLGSLLARIRRDRIVAIDTNPDYGSLGPTLTPSHGVFVDDLLELMDESELTMTQLDAHLGRGPDGLMVLPAPTDPQRMARLDRQAYARVIEHLQQRAGVLVLDCGTGLQEPAAQAAVTTADQLVLVSDAEPATATLVADASRLLLRSGVPLTLLVNKLPKRAARLDLDALGELMPEASGMSVLQSDLPAASRVAAGDYTWAEPTTPWSIELRELAAALLAQWPELGLTVSEHDASTGAISLSGS